MTLQHEFILFLASVQRPITEKSGPQQSREFRVDFRWAWHEGACSCAVGLELLRVPYPHSHGQVGEHARSQLRPQLQVQVQRQIDCGTNSRTVAMVVLPFRQKASLEKHEYRSHRWASHSD